MIEKLLAYISQAGAGELIFRGGEQGGPCGENNDGYDYWSPNISGKPIDVNEVIKAGDEFLVPAGFSKRIMMVMIIGARTYLESRLKWLK